MSVFQDEFDVKFHSKRFQIKECPYVISTGYFYVVVDTLNEMSNINFDSSWDEAEEFCIFINGLIDKINRLKYVKRDYKMNSDIFLDFFNRYEECWEMLEDKYDGVDVSKYDVLLELDNLVNERKD